MPLGMTKEHALSLAVACPCGTGSLGLVEDRVFVRVVCTGCGRKGPRAAEPVPSGRQFAAAVDGWNRKVRAEQ